MVRYFRVDYIKVEMAQLWPLDKMNEMNKKKWIKLEVAMLSEICQEEKDNYQIAPLKCGI